MTIRHTILAAATALTAAAALTSCDWVRDDTDDCPNCQGTLSVKIEQRRNMLSADAAPQRVGGADIKMWRTGTGDFTRRSVSREELARTGYYADMEYPGAGRYDFLVWAGRTPGMAAAQPDGVDLGTQEGDTIRSKLPLIFHGKAEAVDVEDKSDNVATVDLTQDTKMINVTINYNGSRQLSGADFSVVISAPNSVLDADNQTAASHTTAYAPYEARTQSIEHQQVVAYALSTLRLMEKDAGRCRLAIDYRPADGPAGQRLLDLPLTDYLLMCKDFEGADLTAQEYLDRQSTYHIVFVIQDTGRPAAPLAISSFYINNWQIRDDQPVIKPSPQPAH